MNLVHRQILVNNNISPRMILVLCSIQFNEPRIRRARIKDLLYGKTGAISAGKVETEAARCRAMHTLRPQEEEGEQEPLSIP
jgi:hypothetical protein